MAAASPEAQALLERWRTETDMDERDELLEQLIENNIFPGSEQDAWELEGGLYPDLDDPRFLPKLLRKREFQESKQKSVKDSLAEGKDRCRASEDFELSSVQRFVSRVLSPRTPYNSCLFYHGVGVGKTCAAITVCESYLDAYPSRKVYIIAPPNIQDGFRRTIFDFKDGLKMKGGVNSHRGCTGDIYLALTGTLTEKDPKVIENRITRAIRSRYEFFGYTSFYNHIKKILDKIPKGGRTPEEYETLQRNTLRKEFSQRVMIIDEAHNLRDSIESADEEKDDIQKQDTSDSKGGKKLTPFLRHVLEVSEGITLVLMTATPMYNSYIEIIFLMNLLLLNDKFPEITKDEIFNQKTQSFTEQGKYLLGKVASSYVSFMRGENPLTFPLRLEPLAETRITTWAKRTPNGSVINSFDRQKVAKLPCVGASFDAKTEALYKEKATEIVSGSQGLGITNMDLLIQAGNWMYPSTPGAEDDILDRIREGGFDSVFEKEKRGNTLQYRVKEEFDASWLLEENLPAASGKCAELMRRLKKSKGLSFIYSRFVASGALTIALALEANGYTNAQGHTLLQNGIQRPDGRQCALCEFGEKAHSQQNHKFKPAKYVLLTGSIEISPNNAGAIDAARSSKNMDGEEVKVVIGSQIAGEGLDLRYIREIFVFDSWYHLNKLEQVIGRGIRNCSHAALPEEKRNCTVTLLVNTYASDPDLETIDMYSYRTALAKAIVVGKVTRVLKENALDCTLNHDAIHVSGLGPIPKLYDSQGEERLNVNRNDTPLTAMCDWLDTCEYDCVYRGEVVTSDIPLDEQDSSTYDEYTARYQLHNLKKYIQQLFGEEKQGFITFENLQSHFNTIPRPLLASLMSEMVQQKELKIRLPTGDGKIIYRHGYYIFQPDRIRDTSIPIAMRVADIPIARDHYAPKVIVQEEEGEQAETRRLIGDEAAKKIAVGDEDSEALWNEAVEWCDAIRTGTADTKLIPAGIEEELRKLRESAGVVKVQKERIQMVLWFYAAIKDKPDVRERFANCVLEYFWDEYITHGTRRELLISNLSDPLITLVSRDMVWILDGKKYMRFLNAENEIEYLCVGENGKVETCSVAVSQVLSRETASDPILRKPLDVRHTGFEYGFIMYNPKKMKFVFKNGKPPAPNGKLGRGSECSINSKIDYPTRLLERFGATLREKGMDDIGLNEIYTTKNRIQNSVRICTVCDLALRYMDAAKVQGKRWFYRPLEAKVYRHPPR